ncbi:hypothetical protein GCM10010508_38500 [Streptomyces naganishii JCM 4654]|uniref:Uncharacterized protein n=1 Tax=Streptomyces naganishii JCM 4654 TaxID=1306179 RepID=A0A918Y5M8_9ACTN|nr:hypothetical protein GCM10010508_38500 [Streptomyces naganishii JCM 4654]
MPAHFRTHMRRDLRSPGLRTHPSETTHGGPSRSPLGEPLVHFSDGVRYVRGRAAGEWYGALLPISAVSAAYEGVDLGAMAAVVRTVRFGPE